jgi:hypothetical protein
MNKKRAIILGVLAILTFLSFRYWYIYHYEPLDIIKFNDKRLITSSDFRGMPDEDIPSNSSGQYRILFRHDCSKGNLKYQVYAFMDPNTSWMIDKTREKSLVSQRITFKCYELYARKLKKVLTETDNICDYSSDELENIGAKNYSELEDFLSIMYADCEGGDENLKIRNWGMKVDSLLTHYSQFKEERN